MMSPEESPPPVQTSKRKGKGRKKKLPWPRSQIKRIMQSDDYVGQVNQKVVAAMSQAMHGFTTHILDRAIDVCREKDLRKIDEGVLKEVFNHDDKLDFLRELACTLKSTKRKRNSGKPGVEHDQVPQRRTTEDASDEDASDEGSEDELTRGSRTNVERDAANGYSSSRKRAPAEACDRNPQKEGSSPTRDSKLETVPFTEQVKKILKPASSKITSLDSGSDSDY